MTQRPILAITGHRPSRIKDIEKTKESIGQKLEEIMPSILIQGMAVGVDMWSAHEALKRNVPYIAVRPWAGHGAQEQDVYERTLRNAKTVVTLNPVADYPGPHTYIIRNRWMVDHADLLLAVWDGKKSGGTWSTVRYASEKGIEVVRITP